MAVTATLQKTEGTLPVGAATADVIGFSWRCCCYFHFVATRCQGQLLRSAIRNLTSSSDRGQLYLSSAEDLQFSHWPRGLVVLVACKGRSVHAQFPVEVKWERKMWILAPMLKSRSVVKPFGRPQISARDIVISAYSAFADEMIKTWKQKLLLS